MSAARVPIGPCPLGLPEMLTGAHMTVQIIAISTKVTLE